MSEMTKRIAVALAKENGDAWEDVPASKTEWIVRRGVFGGRFRDVNEPMQSDYIGMARVAIATMREPTLAMLSRGEATIFEYAACAEEWQMDVTREGYQAMIDAA